MDKHVRGIRMLLATPLGVDAVERARELQLVAERLVAAQARADHEESIAACIERLHRRRDIEGAERKRVVLRNDAASLHARDHAKAQIDELLHRRAGMARAAAKPEQRPFRLGKSVYQAVACMLIRGWFYGPSRLQVLCGRT